jgi:hypothetical protein
MGFDLGNLLGQYLGGGAANPAQAPDDFERAAQAAPRETVAQGVIQALRSDATPPFPQMLAQMFGNSNPDQRAGMLNQLIAGAGPGLMGKLGGLFGGNAGERVTPEQASQVSPEQIKEIAEKAQQENPGILDRMGEFYAEHPTAVKAIGATALAVALGAMAQGIQRRNPTPEKEKDMGILSNIFHKIFPSKAAATQAPAPGTAPAAAPGGQQNVPPPPATAQAQQAGQPTQVTPAATGPAATLAQQVDVEEILTNKQKASGQQLNWRTSIVDLLKLLDLDSSLQARKELAAELHYTGDTNDSASMTIWLHKQVMKKLAENGGKVPADLQD